MLSQNGSDITHYLQWKDRAGEYHNFTGGDNCNKMLPQMNTETFEFISNSKFLPITGVRYGPLGWVFERSFSIL